MSDKKKFAGVDFDKAFTKVYTIDLYIPKYKEAGIINSTLEIKLDKIKKDFEKHKTISYNRMCQLYGEYFAEAFIGASQQKMIEVSAKLIDETYDDIIRSSAAPLIDLLKENNYDPVFVSLAPIEILRPAAFRLGINRVLGFQMNAPHGIYDGTTTTDIYVENGKGIVLKSLKEQGTYDWTDSIAYGDSPNDISMLQMVDYGVILNATRGMDKPENRNGFYLLDNSNVIEGTKNILGLD